MYTCLENSLRKYTDLSSDRFTTEDVMGTLEVMAHDFCDAGIFDRFVKEVSADPFFKDGQLVIEKYVELETDQFQIPSDPYFIFIFKNENARLMLKANRGTLCENDVYRFVEI